MIKAMKDALVSVYDELKEESDSHHGSNIKGPGSIKP